MAMTQAKAAEPKFAPRLIVFEGIDGSGKTTLSKMFCDFLRHNDVDCTWLREPGDSIWGQKIRQMAEIRDNMPAEDELLYFIEDRKWDVQNNILPALYRGTTVILDRYYFSNACYQGARGLNMNDIVKRNLTFAPIPDLTYIIDVSIETGLARIAQTARPPARLFEKREHLAKVRENYRLINGPGIIFINGEGSAVQVFTEIKNHFNSFFKLHPSFT
jgi:dTMP kinase